VVASKHSQAGSSSLLTHPQYSFDPTQKPFADPPLPSSASSSVNLRHLLLILWLPKRNPSTDFPPGAAAGAEKGEGPFRQPTFYQWLPQGQRKAKKPIRQPIFRRWLPQRRGKSY